MSMSTCVIGLRDSNDPKHLKMVAALQACLNANLKLPEELTLYFNGTSNPDSALEVALKSKKGSRESEAYIDVAVADIPSGVKVIRFSNSW